MESNSEVLGNWSNAAPYWEKHRKTIEGMFAPITQAGWNPARDLGPRLVAVALGWGGIALPGPGGGFWVYVLGPLAGAPLGGLAWRLLGLEGDAEPAWSGAMTAPGGRATRQLGGDG